MADVVQYAFNFKEVAEALVKKQGLHEGIWGIAVKFGFGAANTIGPDQNLVPTAMVPLLEIGLTKQDEMTSLAVDAAAVNPRLAKEKKRSSK